MVKKKIRKVSDASTADILPNRSKRQKTNKVKEAGNDLKQAMSSQSDFSNKPATLSKSDNSSPFLSTISSISISPLVTGSLESWSPITKVSDLTDDRNLSDFTSCPNSQQSTDSHRLKSQQSVDQICISSQLSEGLAPLSSQQTREPNCLSSQQTDDLNCLNSQQSMNPNCIDSQLNLESNSFNSQVSMDPLCLSSQLSMESGYMKTQQDSGIVQNLKNVVSAGQKDIQNIGQATNLKRKGRPEITTKSRVTRSTVKSGNTKVIPLVGSMVEKIDKLDSSQSVSVSSVSQSVSSQSSNQSSSKSSARSLASSSRVRVKKREDTAKVEKLSKAKKISATEESKESNIVEKQMEMTTSACRKTTKPLAKLGNELASGSQHSMKKHSPVDTMTLINTEANNHPERVSAKIKTGRKFVKNSPEIPVCEENVFRDKMSGKIERKKTEIARAVCLKREKLPRLDWNLQKSKEKIIEKPAKELDLFEYTSETESIDSVFSSKPSSDTKKKCARTKSTFKPMEKVKPVQTKSQTRTGKVRTFGENKNLTNIRNSSLNSTDPKMQIKKQLGDSGISTTPLFLSTSGTTNVKITTSTPMALLHAASVTDPKKMKTQNNRRQDSGHNSDFILDSSNISSVISPVLSNLSEDFLEDRKVEAIPLMMEMDNDDASSLVRSSQQRKKNVIKKIVSPPSITSVSPSERAACSNKSHSKHAKISEKELQEMDQRIAEIDDIAENYTLTIE